MRWCAQSGNTIFTATFHRGLSHELATDPVKQPLVPSVTGNPAYDTAIGYIAVHVGAVLAVMCITWMNAHGFDTASLAKSGIDMSTLIAGAVAGIIISAAAWIWGQWRTCNSQKAIVNETVNAALTGVVPAAIAAKMSPEQAQAIEAAPNAKVGA